jgi:DNA-binding response OmpR family regulator
MTQFNDTPLELNTSYQKPALPGEILVVEDDPTICQLIAAALEEEGYSVTVTFDGQNGLKQAYQSPPRLVITDVMLPQMDGLTLVNALRSHPQTQNIPVIMVSAVASKLAQASQHALTRVEYLAKPFDLEQLLARVAHCISLKAEPSPFDQAHSANSLD